MSIEINREDLEKWADYLLNHSLGGVSPDDLIMVKGEPITWPLMVLLQNKIFAAGGLADVNLVPPDNDRGKVWGASAARYGTVEQIQKVPKWMMARYEAMTKYIEILGAESPNLFANLPPDTEQALMRADEPLKTVRIGKPWVLTLYPTQAFADLEDMTLEEYAEVVVSASTVDPKFLEEVEEPIYQQMSKSRKIRIVTQRPGADGPYQLEMRIADRNIIKCTGIRNFPDGEVFTSPDANTVTGQIFVDLPVFYAGTTIQGMDLTFKDGKIVAYRAEQGHDALAKIIETDEGSHRLGEVALGMNRGIQTALKHPLFVEKVGGTLHIAIGASYPECYVKDDAKQTSELEAFAREGVLNRSAQHVDIVTDFRPGGAGKAVFLDDVELKVSDGIWVVP